LPRSPLFRNKQDEKPVGLSKQTMYPFEGFNPSFLLALPSWRDRKSENDKGNNHSIIIANWASPFLSYPCASRGLACFAIQVYSNDELRIWLSYLH
jgi:hypothetical protein